MSGNGGISGTAVAVVFAGSVVAYSGFKGRTISSSLRTLLAGKNPQLNNPVSSGTASAGGNSAGSTSGVDSGTPVHGSNKAIGRALATAYGWGTGSNWDSLDKLWTRESGWSNTAKNPSSGAYGIAQALPQTKYPRAGQESGGSSAQAQISWGLSYIKQRYGSPDAAWAHETANSWY